jgi:NTP pyrophosphatase (non-canonical NTP hydrolase)
MELIKKVYRNTPGGELFPGSKQEITDAIQLARSALGTLAQVVRTAKQVEFPAVPADDRDDRPRLVKEAGDILWYVACFCTEIHVSLGYVGDTNYAKLADRARRDVIRSTGDDR